MHFSLNVISCLLPLVAVISCQSRGADPVDSMPDDAAGIVARNQPALVDTVYLQPSVFSHFITAQGKLSSLQQAVITSPLSGLLLQCHATNGATIAAGGTIASFDTRQLAMQLERAQLKIFNAQKEYESQLLGYEQLLLEKTPAQVADIKEKLRISTGLADALQDEKEVRYALQQAVIKAPFAGRYAQVKVSGGQTVNAGMELFTLYNPSQMVMQAQVLESQVHVLQKGMPATVTLLGAEATPLRASLYDIDPLVNEQGMVLVNLLMQQALQGLKLYPGMHGSAIISMPQHASLVVPRNAVVYRSGKAVVFSYEAGKAKWNYVTVAGDNGEAISISDGLKAGMSIITSNNLQLAHDAPVSPQAKPVGGRP